MTCIRMMLALAAAFCSLFALMGCQQDLDVRGRTFHCADHDDCLEGFRCEVIDAARKACLPVGQPDASRDATDTDDSDGADAVQSDTSSDTGTDADVAPDGSTPCTEGQSLCANKCVDVSTDPNNCGTCGRSCLGDGICESSSCVGECLTTEIEASAPGATPSSATGDDLTLSVPVLETVSLKASPSSHGNVQSYEWRLTERPKDSTSKLSTSDQQETSLLVDLYGQYVVTLAGTYEGDLESCESAKITINVAPTADVAVQLTWETSADSDQTDDVGADVDLHYLDLDGGSGSWESNGDVYWYNPNPNWGDPTTSTDDPKMLIDDADGAGPEHLVHSKLDSDKTYAVGVHYYTDSGFGASHATVRIYVEGLLVAQYDDQYLDHDNFWEVALITGPPGYDVTFVDIVHTTTP